MAANLALILLLSCSFATTADEGAYLVKAAGCGDCHTLQLGAEMAGGVALKTAFGTFFTPNITPDRETGIGDWTFTQFLHALRQGRSPSGDLYYPVFPYRSYSKMETSDIRKIYYYLRDLPPIAQRNPTHELSPVYDQRWLIWFWQELFFNDFRLTKRQKILEGVGPFEPLPNRTHIWNRGAYLVEAVTHCTECHTPRNWLGGLKTNRWLAGSTNSLPGIAIPNITPDPETGVGSWSTLDWDLFLRTGLTKTRRYVSNEMAQVIRNTSSLTEDDRRAMIEYLMSIKPVHNWIERN